MIKRCAFIIILICLQIVGLSQNNQPVDLPKTNTIDSLKRELTKAENDSIRIFIMQRIGFYSVHLNVDSALQYYNAALLLASQRSYAWGETRLLASLSGVMVQQGKFPEALEFLFKALKIAEDNKITYDIARANRRLSYVYSALENFPKAIAYLLKALHVDEAAQDSGKTAIDHFGLADAYEKINKLDSATFHMNIAFKQKNFIKDLMQDVYETNGNIQIKKKNYERASFNYKEGLNQAQINSDLVSSSQLCADISALDVILNHKDSAILYALKGFDYAKAVSFRKGILLNGNLLAELYDSIQPSVALKYYKIAANAKDSLFGVSNIQAIQNLVSGEEAKQRELEDAAVAYRNKLKLYGLLTGLAGLLIIAFILSRNNRQKQKANVLLSQQKDALQTTLIELKATQAQLVQSEKMASLGELTAGIAHEIQNPLNFVNNFSEVNKELLLEMNDEIGKGNIEEVKSIARDVIENEEKINHHGKRADAIVKGMLQHSRASTGEKVPTDINALADEYLRLSYQGLRAKDKDFNADFETDFDESIVKIEVVPQDIGRVLLNLYNNAFYAASLPSKGGFKNNNPTVWVTTKKADDKIVIKVRDNGSGIPQKLLDKIFQPFFTTKPTGQGTGLGLSLSYDIIKAHGGEIKVDTKEGEYTAFTIELPYKNER